MGGFKTQTFAQQRRLVPNMLSTILGLLAETHRPMSNADIVLALCKRFRRSDPDFQRQVRLNLHDAVRYGILRRQAGCFSLRSKRLHEIMTTLAPPRN